MTFGDELWKLYRPLMSQALSRCEYNQSDAQDLVQAVMLKCLENEDKFKKGTNLFSWTVTVLKNHKIDLLRKKSPDIVDPDDLVKLSERSQVTEDTDPVLKLSIERCLGKLTDTRRSVLILNTQGQTAKEISDLLGSSINTVLSHLARAKKAFGACIDPEGEYA
jgi:RNA polymerase sigma factor (sigma-70 family)